MYIIRNGDQVLAVTLQHTLQIHFIDSKNYDVMGLDKWIDTDKQIHPKSITSENEITRQCLKDRILELQQTRDKITYELNRLKSLVEGMQF